jgi:lipopolysaccharide/colanic/teichoic acid biosynthesis glycosyltransferase
MKRMFDLVASALALALLAPLLVAVALLVRINLGSPVLFRQPRPGRGGRIFSLWKFRTMVDARDAGGRTLTDEERLTKFGRTLRSTSLDELPELWNVLRGDMSLVGPRPEMPQVVAGYDAFQRERLEVKPGITGLWQVSSGRNAPIHENLDYDLYYIYNWSFLLDVVILFRTAFCLFSGK